MRGLWKKLTKQHHPIVVGGLGVVFAIYIVHMSLDAAGFTMKLVATALDGMTEVVDHDRARLIELTDSAKRLWRHVAPPKMPPTKGRLRAAP